MKTIERESVRVAVLDNQGRVLLLRAVLPTEEWWELPGGGIEPNETREQAAIRELSEETSIAIDELRAHLGTVDTNFTFNGRRYLQREAVFLASADAVAVKLPPPDPDPAARHTEYRWWRADELADTEEQIHPPSSRSSSRRPSENAPRYSAAARSACAAAAARLS